jgi:hypothetical protein
VLRDGKLCGRDEHELVVRRQVPRATQRLRRPSEPGGVAALPRELLVTQAQERERASVSVLGSPCLEAPDDGATRSAGELLDETRQILARIGESGTGRRPTGSASAEYDGEGAQKRGKSERGAMPNRCCSQDESGRFGTATLVPARRARGRRRALPAGRPSSAQTLHGEEGGGSWGTMGSPTQTEGGPAGRPRGRSSAA